MAGDKNIKVFSDPADLPAWYHRIRRQFELDDLYFGRDVADVSPEDFDEGISELDEEEEDDFECNCEASKDPDYGCECEPKSEDESDVPKMVYNGPSADDYYRLKELREGRKEDLIELCKREEAEKKHLIEEHRCHMKEVQAAYEALEERLKKNNGEGTPINFFDDCEWGMMSGFGSDEAFVVHVRSKSYDLFSVDYLENWYQWDHYNYWKRVDFDESDVPEDEALKPPRSKSRRIKTPSAEPKTGDTVHCRIYASPDDTPDLKPFHAPEHVSLKTYTLKAEDGDYEITIQFIGKDYLKMQVPRHIIKRHKDFPLANSAPEVFEFVGVWKRHKKLCHIMIVVWLGSNVF